MKEEARRAIAHAAVAEITGESENPTLLQLRERTT